MAQLTLEAVINKNLFSDYYLEDLIQKNPEWRKRDHEDVFQKIKDIYKVEMAFLEGLNEPQLEKRFYRRIFQILLPEFEVQATTKKQDFPDYGFFPDSQSLEDAHKNKGKKSFYTNAFAIGEVKRWGAELDKFGRDKHDKRRNPSFQIWLYLHETEPRWGILSNGRKWRLYRQDRPLDCYYEVDLVTLLEKDDIEGFRYFYYFFRKEAFLPSEDGEVFLERVVRESLDYAKEVGDNLKENVYKAMKVIADGFLHWSQNGLDPNDDQIRLEVQKSTMRLLYRFLFLLYAEGKGLLSLSDERYRNMYSFYRLKKEIMDKKEGPVHDYYSPASTTIWFRLKDLFRLISQGSEAFGIPKEQFYIPPYNGGLFEPKRNPNLEKWTIGDTYLADAIDLIARTEVNGSKAFVDYSTLEIRHLGSIYEGLLEYKLKIAEKDMVVRGGKNREWVTLEEFNKERKIKKSFEDFDEFDRVRAGELYLVTDKGERKATGSYYTPDYIVNYIVENTVGPVVEEKWKEALENGKSLVDATLSIKVLDPATGSGHFLVGAVEFLSGKLLEAVQKDIEMGLIEEEGHYTPDWAKREVVSHCIYGVDLNDLAVELAKVSLWLTTISKDKPLSFLDHRLKQGNSLIGATLSDLKYYPNAKQKEDDQTMPSFISPIFITHLIGKIAELEKIRDESLEDIRRKEKVFEEFKQLPEYCKAKALANVYTAIYFGNEVMPTQNKDSAEVYYDIIWAIMGDEAEWRRKTSYEWFTRANKIAEEKSFFHWELEFPEVFFEDGKVKENPGFDVVIGNPPYINAIELSKVISEHEKPFWKSQFQSAKGAYDIYILFYERALSLVKRGNPVSYITPNKFLSAPYAEAFRRYIIQNHQIVSICDFSRTKVFEDPSVYPIITIFKRIDNKSKYTLKVIFMNGTNDLMERIIHHSSENLSKLPGAIWGFLLFPQIDLLFKIEKVSKPLSEISTIQATSTAAESDEFVKALHDGIQSEFEYKFVNTGLINRYDSLWGVEDLFHKGKLYKKPYLDISNKVVSINRQKMYKSKKIIFAKMALKIECYLDLNGEYASANTNCVFDSEFNLSYCGAILNSTLMTFVYKGYFGALIMSGGYFQFQAPQIRVLPIRNINFTTPPECRTKLVEDAKQLYQEYLKSNDYTPTIDFVEARLPKNKEGNFITEKEESDVVHDLLAYLAERMIEMNKEKNKEIREFLEWLENYIETKIDNLTNKTKLKQYYNLDFKELFEILKKNKKKILVNVLSREFHTYLKDEFEKSLSTLSPLMKKIEATDKLIDQIVYKLYGLTDEEIKIVEKSFK